MKVVYFSLILLVITISSALSAIDTKNEAILKPQVLLQMDAKYLHHVIVAEKSTHKLHLFANENGLPKYVSSYQMATGKMAGNKISQGDYRTPEGIYQLTSFITNQELRAKYGEDGKIYGVGSFVMNYPNPFDEINGKTGGGIWLHSTNDETRIDKGLDSRGCIVTANNDLKQISEFIELNKTTVIVVHELKYLSEESWNINKTQIQLTIDNWLDSWRKKEFETYISFYHNEYKDNFRPSFTTFKNYKRSVFSNPGKTTIAVSDISIQQTEQYAVVTFTQHYKSDSIDDIGKKVVYLKRDEYYQWKIISEQWGKVGQNGDTVAQFKPSMRFFASEETKLNEN